MKIINTSDPKYNSFWLLALQKVLKSIVEKGEMKVEEANEHYRKARLNLLKLNITGENEGL